MCKGGSLYLATLNQSTICEPEALEENFAQWEPLPNIAKHSGVLIGEERDVLELTFDIS